MLSIFSSASWPSVCLLWRSVCLGLLLIFLTGLFSFIWYWVVWAVFIFSVLTYFVSCLFCKYFLLFHRLPFHFVDGFLCCVKLLSLIRSHLFMFAFISFAFGEWSKKILPWFMSENVLPRSLLRVLCYHVLYLGLWTILSLFLYVLWESVLI